MTAAVIAVAATAEPSATQKCERARLRVGVGRIFCEIFSQPDGCGPETSVSNGVRISSRYGVNGCSIRLVTPGAAEGPGVIDGGGAEFSSTGSGVREEALMRASESSATCPIGVQHSMPSRQTRISASTSPRSIAAQSWNVFMDVRAGPRSTHQSELRSSSSSSTTSSGGSEGYELRSGVNGPEYCSTLIDGLEECVARVGASLLLGAMPGSVETICCLDDGGRRLSRLSLDPCGHSLVKFALTSII